MEPLVSVILPVYNQEKYIAETIESVLAQTFREFEFIILDDGSTDNSAQIIRKFAAQDTRIIPLFQSNAGRCVATNYAVSEAKGIWCALLDADDVMLPERLEKQLAFHRANPEIDASSCHCYYINDNGNMLGVQRYPHLKTVEECRQALAKNVVITCAFTGLMISRQVFQDLGGLRSAFWPCDDFDFVNRLIEKYVLVINQQILMKYRIHSSAITTKKPLQMFDKVGWVYFCIAQRRAGQPEISFVNYMALRHKDPWWVKLNRRRYNYSQVFFRRAGFNMMSKKYLSFSWQILTASILSPGHIFYKLVNLAKN